MANTLNIGFIGGGLNSAIGQTHKIASEMDGHFRLVSGCFSRDSVVNTQTALRWGVQPERVYATSSDFIKGESTRLDAVVILLPIPDHFDIVIACLSAGLAVICEKALVDTSMSAKQIDEWLREHGGQLYVTYNYSGYPMVRELQQRIINGEFGVIQQVMVEMPQESFVRQNTLGQVSKPQIWRQHDGEIPTMSLDLGVHAHQLVSFLTHDRPADVYAIASHFTELPGIIDTVHAIARYESGMVCNYWYGKSALGYRNGLRIRLMGTQGSAEWLQMDPEVINVSDVLGRKFTLDRTCTENQIANLPRYARFKAGHPAGFIEAFANYYADIALALQGKENRYTCGTETAFEGLQFLENIHLSARMQQKIICKEPVHELS
ncbi:Gfo/Idh/MocA family protein [Pantoea agglomerans]|uniref:Gfo/Idh/MocA family oxidoreductase n=1 Tax=Enterobacter agglomerans TaxID=549 RepID=A0ACC5RQS4_ENTAG|nr:Gfo/Idh/MocA family oxidoreductase [Pantoea agglomerans]MBK4726995.1 Gfo/Idh/MocA family oxidoreductase [Pantoea agglomerans]